MNLVTLCSCILIANSVRNTFSMMRSSSDTLIWNTSHATYVDRNKNTDITKGMTIYKLIIKCHIIFVWRGTVWIKSLSPLRQLIS